MVQRRGGATCGSSFLDIDGSLTKAEYLNKSNHMCISAPIYLKFFLHMLPHRSVLSSTALLRRTHLHPHWTIADPIKNPLLLITPS